MSHEARAQRVTSGWRPWQARCSCGWFAWARQETDAQQLADVHAKAWQAVQS